MSGPGIVTGDAATAVDGTRPGHVAHWERRFAGWTAASDAVAFTHARTALAAVLRAAGLEPGDQVLLSPLTCKVVPLAILGAGLEPVYVDIDARTLNLDAARIADRVGPRTRAVLFQRTYGLGGGAGEALRTARAGNLFFVEDCAQCMPANDVWIGDAAIFSNNPGKPLPAGSGGIVVVRDAGLAAAVRTRQSRLPVTGAVAAALSLAQAWARNRLLRPSLYWTAFDANRLIDASYRPRGRSVEIADEFDAAAGRIHDSQARAGIVWLERAAEIAAHRFACCDDYARLLGSLHGPAVPAGSSLYYYPVLVDRKDTLLERARRDRCEIVAWPISTPIYPVTDDAALGTYRYDTGACPVAEDVARRLVGLPTHPLVRPADRERIAALVLRHMESAK